MGVGYLTGQGGGGSNVKSIQSGSGTLDGSTLSSTIAVSAVNISKSVIIINTSTSGYSEPMGAMHLKAELTGPTTISISRGRENGIPLFYSWVLVEFNNVKSKQTGSLNLGSNQFATQTISQISTAKSLVFWSSFSTSTGPGTQGRQPLCYFTSSTQLAINGNYGSAYNDLSVHWQVIEFK